MGSQKKFTRGKTVVFEDSIRRLRFRRNYRVFYLAGGEGIASLGTICRAPVAGSH